MVSYIAIMLELDLLHEIYWGEEFWVFVSDDVAFTT